MGQRSTPSVYRGPEAGGLGCEVAEEGAAFVHQLEDNLMTVEGGSGCLKELSIPAALLRREVKAICPTSKTKDTHTHTHTRTHIFKPSVSGLANRWRGFAVPNLNTEKTHMQEHGILNNTYHPHTRLL